MIRFRHTLATVKAVLLFCHLSPAGAVQALSAQVEGGSVATGETVSVHIGYEATEAADETTLGTALSVHWNSSLLRLDGVSNLYSLSALMPSDPLAEVDDIEDLDGDPATDRRLHLAWLDVAGGWPGQGVSSEQLATFQFTVLAELDKTRVNVHGIESPPGQDVAGTSALIQGSVPASAVTVTGNGERILAGDASPDVADGTNFGRVLVGSAGVKHLFEVTNPGDVAIAGLTVQVTGDSASDFQLTQAPQANLEASSSSEFEITFAPSEMGQRQAEVTLMDNSEALLHRFAVSGVGYKAYTLHAAVEGAGGSITPRTVQVEHGQPQLFQLLPEQGFVPLLATGCPGILSANQFSMDAVTGGCSLSVRYVAEEAVDCHAQDANLEPPGIGATETRLVQSQANITTQGSYLVEDPAVAVFEAAGSITLGPGFQVKTGATFNARIREVACRGGDR